MPLATLLGQSDWVVPQLPEGPATKDLIDRTRLAQMKSGACIINVSRADVVDRTALIEALKSGRLGGFGLDPLYEEPGRSTDELLKFDNVVISPHIAAQPRFNALNDLADMMENSVERPGGAETKMSKAFRFHTIGGPTCCASRSVEVGEPGPGQVRMRNRAVAVNYRDVLQRSGIHAVKSFPAPIGLESAGVVEAIGPDVSRLQGRRPRRLCVRAGRRLRGAAHRLGRADHPAARRHRRAHGRLDDDPRHDGAHAAARGLRGEARRHHPDPRRRRRRRPDCLPVGEASRRHRHRYRQQRREGRGRARPRLRSSDRLSRARISSHACGEITGGEGLPVVYDSIGKATFEGSLKCLRRRGYMCSFGEASGDPDPVPPRRLGQLGSIYLTHPSVSNLCATRAELLTAANDVFAMVASGKIKIEISREYALKDAARAHADIEQRKTTGSIVLMV